VYQTRKVGSGGHCQACGRWLPAGSGVFTTVDDRSPFSREARPPAVGVLTCGKLPAGKSPRDRDADLRGWRCL
jgi:hypothetical protein